MQRCDRAMLDPIEWRTLAGVMDDLAARGFTEHFMPSAGRLRAVEHDASFSADEVVISEYHRFEGVSDPDDMAILYAIEASGSIRGTLVDAFGVYSDPRVGLLMKEVRVQRPRS